MTTLYHEILVKALPDSIWNLLTTQTGIARWWPGAVSLQNDGNWALRFESGESELIFRIVEHEPKSVLEWLCISGDDDWDNTLVHWRIEPNSSGVRLKFEHRDLRKSGDQLAELNTHWGVCIDHIRRHLHQESG